MPELPEFPEQEEVARKKWRLESVIIDRAPSGIAVRVRDRLVRNGKVTDVYRDRRLNDRENAAIWKKQPFRTQIDLIHTKAE